MSKIKLEHVYKNYRNGGEQCCILEDMNFSIEEGEFISIIGSSGCGKSTTLSILSGLSDSTKGEMYIDGEVSHGTGKNRAVVFQKYSLFPWMTAEKNVSFGIKQMTEGKTKKEIQSMARQYLKAVGLENIGKKYPHQLSGGMQQRVAIARTLAMQPEILLMDEPFGAVDAKTRTVLQDLLLNLLESRQKTQTNKQTIILVTHDIDEAILLSDRIFFMGDKKIKQEFKVPFARPRNRKEIFSTREYTKLRSDIMNLFYEEEKEPAASVELLFGNTLHSAEVPA